VGPFEARLQEFEYVRDTPRLFAALAGLPRRVFLDSCAHARRAARYDIICADPYLVVTSRDGLSRLEYRDRAERSTRDARALLDEALAPAAAPHPELPFMGGAIGYFAYDFGRRLERLPDDAANDLELPDVAFGLYDWAVVVDHAARRSWLAGAGRDPRTAVVWAQLRERLACPPPAGEPVPFRALSPLASNLDRGRYGAAFARIQAHIRRGECYQVNLARRFTAEVEGDPWRAYLKLRETNPAPYAAFLETPEGSILSSSPECFLQLRGKRVRTKPIKGTRRRAHEPELDQALKRDLAASAKDRAENVMIVDLLRNDLGKTCEAGSVHVEKLFDVESYPSVHHLVSTVEGTLKPGCGPLDVLTGCFPGGSITGAPKLAAMQIIEAVEPHRRGVYCGAIGYLGFDGGMELNVAIRTLLHREDRVYFWAGGGIVTDSDVDAEYQETLDKAAALIALTEGSTP